MKSLHLHCSIRSFRLRLLAERNVGQKSMSERWQSVDEIAMHLWVNLDAIYKRIARKQLSAHKVGRLWKFTASEVDAWVRAGKAAGDDHDD
jgi:excisionase family DNA binding protein